MQRNSGNLVKVKPTRIQVHPVRSHDYHGTKMTGTKVVENSMISRNTNSTNRTRILSMVVDFSFINYNSSF